MTALRQTDLPADQLYETKPETEDRRPALREGDPCRKCATPVQKRQGRWKRTRDYYYEYYLFCPKCQTAEPREYELFTHTTGNLRSLVIVNVVELRHADLCRIDLELQARVLAFDWWIANSDRLFVEGAGNPNLLWAEDQRRLVVIDHNLAFDPSLMGDFWEQHAFRDSRRIWSAAFCQGMAAEFQGALGNLETIWNELPEEWMSDERGLTLNGMQSGDSLSGT
jgi:HipA-like kinase